MASIAIAASAALVKPVIEKLSGKLWKDMSMFWKLDKECDKTKNMLKIISKVLEDADKKSITDDLIRHWLSQLQDVAYDVDDLLDDLQIEKQRRSKGKFPVGAVRDFFSTDNNQVKFRDKMVKKIKKINKRLDKVLEERRNFQLVEGNVLMEEDNTERETFSAVDESDVYGRKKEKVIIINHLIHGQNDKTLSVLPIVGKGGIGKTTLAQVVCNDREIKKYFHPIVWVHVPMNFELSKILDKMIECISGKNCGVSHIETQQKNLRSMINGTRFLVILDDVWNEDAAKWDKLNTILTCGMVGSKILVTTRSEKVAMIMGTFDQFRVGILEFQYCWELFKKRAFRYVNEEENVSLVNIGKEIVTKCNGLPLAAKHLGNLAGSREVDWCTIRDSDIWQMTEYYSGIKPSLVLSYFYLPSHLKRCFAYCSLFPKGFKFQKEYLTQLWICEGFIPKSEGPKHLESTANSCFDLLLSRSFFEENRESIFQPDEYKMHDLIHELACYIAGDEFILKSKSKNKLSAMSFRYSSVNSNDISQIKKLRSILLPDLGNVEVKLDSIMQLQYLRVLDLSNCWIKELPSSIGNLRHLKYLNLSRNYLEIVPDSVTALLSLNVLNLSGCEYLKEIPTNFGDLKNLKLLNLSVCMSLNKLPMSLCRLSTSLKVLNLTCCKYLKEIPTSIGDLENLEVLNLWACCRLEKLPTSLCRLRNLRCLDLSHCSDLVSIPKGIGKLTKLERLPIFIAGGDEGCSISELHQLNFIKNDLLLVIKKKCDLQDFGSANLGAKQYLKYLKIHMLSASDEDFIKHPVGSLQVPHHLESLWLRYSGFDAPYLRCDLPSSLRTMDFPFMYTKLIDVHLDGLNECECFPQFGRLPQLKVLHLSLYFSITKIKEQFSGTCGIYPVLEQLELGQLYNDDIVAFGETVAETESMSMMFPCLKKVQLISCPFTTVFSFLPRTIEILDIRGDCGQQILSRRSLQGLSRLRKLMLTSVPLKFTVFEGMMYLKALEELEIMFSEWPFLPPGLLCHHLPSFKKLVISHMEQLRLLEEESQEWDGISRNQLLHFFANVEILQLESCNSLAALPDWLGSLSYLKSLRVANCPNITEFPQSMARLTALQSLELAHLPSIQRLPEGMEQIAFLQNLTIDNCLHLSRQWKIERGKDDEVYYKKEGGDWCKISHIRYLNIFPVIENSAQCELEIVKSEI
ncbi:hypothetical protein LUZ62_021043 [Rhynchospora pubera]|uniref:Uncharacterized protein n=1 Tax=Rhynchospora pubera TaxID=906938 RepID=A0AAV8GTA6_9POAL|nr:hypothetical protein LUZ62_021043 [Rhynchospora pubera]